MHIIYTLPLSASHRVYLQPLLASHWVSYSCFWLNTGYL